jgi:hypothetical protein
MGWVKRLVDLEPTALRQAKYVHCATQQFCIIFAPELVTGAIAGNIRKYLFQNGNSFTAAELGTRHARSGR